MIKIRTLATIFAITLILVGIVVISGWVFHLPLLTQIRPGMVAMVVNTALGFLLTGIVVLISNYPFAYQRILQLGLSSIIIIFAALSLSQDIFQYDIGIDRMFINPWLLDGSPMPGRMAQNTSIGFILSGVIGILLPYGYRKSIGILIQLLTFFILVIAIVGIIVYSLKLQYVFNWYTYTRMAVHTATMFAIVSGAWWAIWSQSDWFYQFYKDKEDSKIIVITGAILLSLLLIAGLSGVSIVTHLLEGLDPSANTNLDVETFSQQIITQMQFIFLTTFSLILMGLTLLYWQVAPLVRKVVASELEANKSKQRLQESEERYAMAVKGSHTGLWVWDVGTEHVYFSPQFKHLLGYSDDEFPNLMSSFQKSLHPDDYKRVLDNINRHVKEGVPYNVEYRIKKKSGEYRWFHAIGELRGNEEGSSTRMAGSVTDVTERKKVEQMKNEFISIVSHELRTPLTSIKGSIGLLIGKFSDNCNDKAKKLLEIANNNCERLIRLINDILDIEKIEAGKMDFNFQKINIKDLVNEAAKANEEYVKKFHVKLHVECNEDAFVFGDYDRLMQVVTNLISNAAKFSHEGGEVVLSVTTNNSFVRVLVKDNGEGIPVGFQSKIFEKFVQADSSNTRQIGGTGLGLSICKAIVEKHHGKIGFVTLEGKGTTFYFDLVRNGHRGNGGK